LTKLRACRSSGGQSDPCRNRLTATGPQGGNRAEAVPVGTPGAAFGAHIPARLSTTLFWQRATTSRARYMLRLFRLRRARANPLTYREVMA